MLLHSVMKGIVPVLLDGEVCIGSFELHSQCP